MASVRDVAPGLVAQNAPAFDAKPEELARHSTPDDEHPVAPDQFDPKFETTRSEVWSYYAYYVGNNGLTLFNFAPTAFQVRSGYLPILLGQERFNFIS